MWAISISTSPNTVSYYGGDSNQSPTSQVDTQYVAVNNNPLLCIRSLELMAPICTRVVSVQAPPAFPVPMLLGQQFQILHSSKKVKHLSHCAWLIVTYVSSRPRCYRCLDKTPLCTQPTVLVSVHLLANKSITLPSYCEQCRHAHGSPRGSVPYRHSPVAESTYLCEARCPSFVRTDKAVSC